MKIYDRDFAGPVNTSETRQPGCRMVINAAYGDILRGVGFDAFDKAYGDAGGEEIKRIRERTVCRYTISWQGRERILYVKRHEPERQFFTRLLGRIWPKAVQTEGGREFGNCCDFRRNGLATVTPVAMGERFSGSSTVESFLITEDFSPYVSLEDIVRFQPEILQGGHNREKRKNVLRRIGAYARRMHTKGFNHQDFNATHLLLHDLDEREPKVALFDLQRVSRNLLASFRWPIKSLAEMNYTMPSEVFQDDERLFLFQSYKGKEQLGILDRLQWYWIRRKTRRIARHTARRRAENIKNITPDEYEKLLADAGEEAEGLSGDKLLRKTDGRYLRLTGEKRSFSGDLSRRCLRRCCRNAVQLNWLGVPALTVDALYYLARQSMYVMMHTRPAGSPLRDYMKQAKLRQGVWEELAGFLAGLHNKGNQDPSLSVDTILVLADGGFGLRNLDAIRISNGPLGVGPRIRNLRQVLASLPGNAAPFESGLSGFVARYLEESSLSPWRKKRLGKLLVRDIPELAGASGQASKS